MVGHAAGREQSTTLLTNNSADVIEQALLSRAVNERFAMLGAEHKVVIQAGE
jgi:hypothetical protein